MSSLLRSQYEHSKPERSAESLRSSSFNFGLFWHINSWRSVAPLRSIDAILLDDISNSTSLLLDDSGIFNDFSLFWAARMDRIPEQLSRSSEEMELPLQMI